MDWNTLLSVFLGGVLATIPVIITIRNQSRERDKDRQEQRREAKTQLALELMRNDIQMIEDCIDSYLKIIEIIKGVAMSASENSPQHTDIIYKILSMFTDSNH